MHCNYLPLHAICFISHMESDVTRLRHDLRNKLNALRLSVSALEIAEDQQEALEWLDTIDRAADRLAELLPDDLGLTDVSHLVNFSESNVPLNTWSR
jgi:signal transduction histidine kinase